MAKKSTPSVRDAEPTFRDSKHFRDNIHDLAEKFRADIEKHKQRRRARQRSLQTKWSNLFKSEINIRREEAAQDKFEKDIEQVLNDPEFDPTNEKFNIDKWLGFFVDLSKRQGNKFSSKRLGASFTDLSVYGYGSTADYQKTVANVVIAMPRLIMTALGSKIGLERINILQNIDGLVRSGEMCVVLGRPGSGCTTYLKVLAGETRGLYLDDKSSVDYQGISYKNMHSSYRGETIYNAENEIHFPNLTVGQTLNFAAHARAPHNRFPGITREQHSEFLTKIVMAVFGLSHTVNTRVGDDFIRGVSGGERKRVSIAECALAGCPIMCWDNSTRGLDSANAIEFVKTLSLLAKHVGGTSFVSIYQCPSSAFELFDKVTVLYEGRQIYFGPIGKAKKFFTSRGWACPERQSVPDFLTSLTNPSERTPLPGWEKKVPHTAVEFEKQWLESRERKRLLKDIAAFREHYVPDGEFSKAFAHSRRQQQSQNMSRKSPYTLSYLMQIKLCTRRGFQRLFGDMTNFYATVFGNTAISIVLGSVFYNMGPSTDTVTYRGSLIFFAILMNAFSSALEILTLYAQRPIVEKQYRYAFYHPNAEALASITCNLPSKILTCIGNSTPLYFLANLRRNAGNYFFFLLISFTAAMVMSHLFRTIAASSSTLSEALCPAAILILGLVIYTGFTIPTDYMLGWIRWFNYINPIGYAFESLLINEFHGRHMPCETLVPRGGAYNDISLDYRVCSTTGSLAGQDYVDGDRYLEAAFKYRHTHKWRNFGIMIGFFLFFTALYLIATTLIQAAGSKGEILVYPRSKIPRKRAADAEAVAGEDELALRSTRSVQEEKTLEEQAAKIQRQEAIFHWRDLCLDIKIKNENRRILSNVDGWVKPGTLTALMGASGAGKTTLLDALASRITFGVLTDDVFVDGRPRDASFQRKTGYVQQRDLHLETATTRESLRFSALCRQPRSVTKAEKYAYVEDIIALLEMESYADAVVGVPGEGLNVEQRKRLTIGVELAAKPELLLFFDEPTSGLDSQTAWSMCKLMRKLADNGQAILCTIHQPSAMLIQEFDRLLFLARGGRTVYFGDIGPNCSTLVNYFERNGAHPCPPAENPAEWMLEVVGAAPGHIAKYDWHEVWRASPEFRAVKQQLATFEKELPNVKRTVNPDAFDGHFAMPFSHQLWYCFVRVWQQYWRTPSYIYSKIALCLFAALFIGFSFFKADITIQGLQNQMYGIFMLTSTFGTLVQQIMPAFVTQRDLYEVRERPANTYSWPVFLLAQMLVEVPWQIFVSILTYFSWYYPIGFYRNAAETGAVHERGALMFLLIMSFYLFTSTFAQMIIAGVKSADVGGTIATMLFLFCQLFCGVLITADRMPGFWIFMYRVSPFTYLLGAMMSTTLGNTEVTCASNEIVKFNPPPGSTCGTYMEGFIGAAGGYLIDANATTACGYCPIGDTNTWLASLRVYYSERWRNYGIFYAYIVFNIAAYIAIYYVARVPKKAKKAKAAQPEKASAKKANTKKTDTKKGGANAAAAPAVNKVATGETTTTEKVADDSSAKGSTADVTEKSSAEDVNEDVKEAVEGDSPSEKEGGVAAEAVEVSETIGDKDANEADKAVDAAADDGRAGEPDTEAATDAEATAEATAEPTAEPTAEATENKA